MKYFFIISIYLLFIAYTATAQQAVIDTIPFSLNSRFLVFKGSINGVAIDFAFDTGAAYTVSNTNTNTAANIEVKDGKRGVKDANQQVARIQNTRLDDIGIGSRHIKDLKAVTFDMPYLNCAKLVLLGQDVIKQFNWQIDFEKQVLYVSTTAFEPKNTMVNWPINYKNNRPHTDFSINGTTYKNCLIDFGYTQFFDINPNIRAAYTISQQKQATQQVNNYITSSMGLMGLGKPDNVTHFLLDSVYFNNTLFTNIPANISTNTDTKLGVQFFNTTCISVIFNFSTNKMYILPNNHAVKPTFTLDARVSIKDGHFTITGKNTSPNSSATTLNIGEVVTSVNGKTISDFADECAFLLWTTSYNDATVTIEKLNGEKIVVKRSSMY